MFISLPLLVVLLVLSALGVLTTTGAIVLLCLVPELNKPED
jgi:hypothetical protein